MQSLDSKLNYSNIIATNTTLTDRTSSVVTSTSGSNFSSEARSNIEFLVPPVSYLDQSSSYLRANVKIVAGTLGTPVTSRGHVLFDGSPAISCFQSCTVYNAENQVISDIQDLPSHILNYIRSKGPEYVSTIGKGALGYFPEIFENARYFGGTQNSTLYPLVDAVVATDPDFWQFPGRVTYAAGANTPLTTAGSSQEAQIAIPLELFSGLFSSNKYLPLKHMGTRSSALRIVLSMADPRDALVVVGATNAESDILADSNPQYTVKNCELVVEYVNVSQVVDDVIKQAATSPAGLHMSFTDTSTKVDNGWQSTANNYSVMSPKYTMSLRDIVVQLKPTNNLRNYKYPSVTGSYKIGLQSIQTKVGPSFYPSSPLKLLSNGSTDGGFNGSAFLELTKTASGLNNKNHQGYFNIFKSKAGYEVGFSFCRKDDGYSDVDVDQVKTGIDTRSGSSNVQVLLEKSSAVSLADSSTISIVMLYKTDNILMLHQGTAQAFERS